MLNSKRTGNINSQRKKIITFLNQQKFLKGIDGNFFKNNFNGKEIKEGVLLFFNQKVGEISETQNESIVSVTTYLKSNNKCQNAIDILYEYCKDFVGLKTKDDLNISCMYPKSDPTEIYRVGDFFVATFDIKIVYFEDQIIN